MLAFMAKDRMSQFARANSVTEEAPPGELCKCPFAVQRKALRTPTKSQCWEILSNIDDECPQNGSKQEFIPPKRNTGVTLQGPFVALQPDVELAEFISEFFFDEDLAPPHSWHSPLLLSPL